MANLIRAGLAAFAASVLVSLSTAAPVAQAAPICADAILIGVHGTGEGPLADGSRADDTGSPNINSIEKEFHAAYTKARPSGLDELAAIWYDGPVDYAPQSMLDAIARAQAAINERLARYRDCPRFPTIILAGYSVGAWAISDWLLKPESQNLHKFIRGVALLGDPQSTSAAGLYRGLGRQYFPLPGKYPVPILGVETYKTCILFDAICGRGYPYPGSAGAQLAAASACAAAPCPHHDYVERGFTKKAGEFLARRAVTHTPAPPVA